MVHAACSPARVPGFVVVPRLDFNRILGYATAIAVHAVLFLLLLVPITAPPAATETIDQPVIDIFRRVEPPPPPPPPVHVEVTRQAHAAPNRPTQPPQPPDNQQAVVDEAVVTNPVAASPVVEDTTPVRPAGPLAGVQLEYAKAPAPTYPRDALREGIEGTVLLRVLVDVDGRPLDVRVEHSSGNRSLDRAARDQVLQRWRFRPAMENGRAVQAIGLVPVDFRLN